MADWENYEKPDPVRQSSEAYGASLLDQKYYRQRKQFEADQNAYRRERKKSVGLTFLMGGLEMWNRKNEAKAATLEKNAAFDVAKAKSKRGRNQTKATQFQATRAKWMESGSIESGAALQAKDAVHAAMGGAAVIATLPAEKLQEISGFIANHTVDLINDFYDDEKAVEGFMGTSEEEALKAITNPYSERIDRIRNDNILSAIGRKIGILDDSKYGDVQEFIDTQREAQTAATSPYAQNNEAMRQAIESTVSLGLPVDFANYQNMITRDLGVKEDPRTHRLVHIQMVNGKQISTPLGDIKPQDWDWDKRTQAMQHVNTMKQELDVAGLGYAEIDALSKEPGGGKYGDLLYNINSYWKATFPESQSYNAWVTERQNVTNMKKQWGLLDAQIDQARAASTLAAKGLEVSQAEIDLAGTKEVAAMIKSVADMRQRAAILANDLQTNMTVEQQGKLTDQIRDVAIATMQNGTPIWKGNINEARESFNDDYAKYSTEGVMAFKTEPWKIPHLADHYQVDRSIQGAALYQAERLLAIDTGMEIDIMRNVLSWYAQIRSSL